MPVAAPPPFPQASGRRVQWADVPATVRSAVEDRLGSAVVAARSEGGPDPEAVWSAHPVSRGVDGDRVGVFVAALAGMFLHASLLPDEPGQPTLRPFQGAQGEHALAWLARRG